MGSEYRPFDERPKARPTVDSEAPVRHAPKDHGKSRILGDLKPGKYIIIGLLIGLVFGMIVFAVDIIPKLSKGSSVGGEAVSPNQTEVQREGSFSACELDFQRAAGVPLGQVNDHFLEETLYSCQTPDEWKAMMRKYPLVLGVSNPTDAEINLVLDMSCQEARPESTVCP